MDSMRLKQIRRDRRRTGIRKRVTGTPERPRLTVYRSQKHMYAQIIDDVAGKTLAAASSSKLDKGTNKDAATQVGKQLAQAALAAGIKAVAFDRNGFRFHGRIKALADAAREGGLQF